MQVGGAPVRFNYALMDQPEGYTGRDVMIGCQAVDDERAAWWGLLKRDDCAAFSIWVQMRKSLELDARTHTPSTLAAARTTTTEKLYAQEMRAVMDEFRLSEGDVRPVFDYSK